MKKLIQICSLLTLVVAFSFVSANAQTVQRYEAEIPFAFSIGGKSYEAGNYVMRLTNRSVGKVITLENSGNRVLQTFYVMERGDAPTKKSFLRFVRNSERMSLAKIYTPERSFAVAGASLKSKVAKNSVASSAGSDSETVTVTLQ